MIEVLGAMEAMGIAVDLPKGQALRDRFAQTMDALEREIMKSPDKSLTSVHPNSSVTSCLKAELPPVKKTKTGYSTDAEVLMTLSSIHPLPEKILQHRHYAS